MPAAAIALGSNLGDRAANLAAAVERLRPLGIVTAVSAWIETDPVGYLDQPPFLNGAALLETRLAPEALLRELLGIEQQMGRDRSHGIAKGPRLIDLDLLLYEDRTLQTPSLTLPHPEMHLRSFVLVPLAEIAPGWEHPLLHRTIRQLAEGPGEGSATSPERSGNNPAHRPW